MNKGSIKGVALRMALLLFLIGSLSSCVKEVEDASSYKWRDVAETQSSPTTRDSIYKPGRNNPEALGTSEDPYLIYSAADWNRQMKNHGTENGAYFRIGSSFQLSGSPVCDTFRGVLDGNGMSISLINRPLFIVVDGGEISDLNLDVQVSSLSEQSLYSWFNEAGVKEWVFGGVACMAHDAGFFHCSCKMNVNYSSDENLLIAPLCGNLSEGFIRACESSGVISIVTDWSANVGGVVVSVDDASWVMDCASTVAVSIDGIGSVGGIAEFVSGELHNCYAIDTLRVSGAGGTAGGVAHYCRGGIIDNCYFYGKVNAEQQASVCNSVALGGIVRFCYGSYQQDVELVARSSNRGTVEFCETLSNAVQLRSPGYYGSQQLVSELNSRRDEVGMGFQWRQRNGVVDLVFEP